ncbi:MAG: VWA domain-containing protein [Mesorhizobium sp.]|nr:VWA domain-containing protein [Mesorhizobium sp.]
MSDSKTPAKVERRVDARSDGAAVEAFIRQAKALAVRGDGGSGRLVLALDATMSRQPSWDLACALQADMFDAAAKTGRLDMQLVYFRGIGECRASRFVSDAATLKALMSAISCRGGHTQIGKVLSHGLKETAAGRIHAIVYIGDAMEESLDDLAEKAGALGLHGVPVFVFQEGFDGVAETAFKEIARLSKGAWFRFDRTAADTLSRLLASIAIFATGGMKALEARGTAEDRLLIANMRGGRA